MANDKDFIVKNAVEVGGPTNVTLGTVTSNNIDLATGNYFKDTPSGTSTYSISNAGDVQSFQLEVTGGLDTVAQNFSTTLYTGTGSAQTITNGIDLSGEGGLVWTKSRNNAIGHALVDTENGVGKYLRSDSSAALRTDSYAQEGVTSFNSNGYSLGDWANEDRFNRTNYTYASWTWRKATKFFDVVTYSGDSNSSRVISHNLGSAVGMIIIKTLNSNDSWNVFHRGLDNGLGTGRLFLDLTNSVDNNTLQFLSADSSSVTFANNAAGNYSGNDYVMYLFAHDTASDSQIKCGSYTGTSSSIDINLGWEPQWLLIKRSDTLEDWAIVDNVRGIGTDPLLAGLKALAPNTSSAEEAPAYSPIVPSSTGFTAHTGYDARYAANGGTYIYMAIRNAADLDLTWPSSIEFAGGIAPSAPATGETDILTFSTDDGGTSYIGTKTADNLS